MDLKKNIRKSKTNSVKKQESYFITDEQYKENTKLVNEFIENCKNYKLFLHNKLLKIVDVSKDKDFNFILDKLSKTSTNDDAKESTGMFPSESNLWSIGCFGSMWIDIKDPFDNLIRFCFYGFVDTAYGRIPQFEIIFD